MFYIFFLLTNKNHPFPSITEDHSLSFCFKYFYFLIVSKYSYSIVTRDHEQATLCTFTLHKYYRLNLYLCVPLLRYLVKFRTCSESALGSMYLFLLLLFGHDFVVVLCVLSFFVNLNSREEGPPCLKCTS